MIVHLPRVPLHVIVFGAAFCDVEGGARDDEVRGVGAAGPFLAAMRESSAGCWLGLWEIWEMKDRVG